MVICIAACATSGALYALIACFTACGCLYSCLYRSKMRRQYTLEESPCGDCLVHCCCETCALCQEYRELKTRGFDMSIGKLKNNFLPRTLPHTYTSNGKIHYLQINLPPIQAGTLSLRRRKITIYWLFSKLIFKYVFKIYLCTQMKLSRTTKIKSCIADVF